MLIFGLILLAIAIGCFFGYRNAKAKVGEVLHTQTSSIGDIAERAGAVAEVLGTGNSNDYTEIKGKIEPEEVLVSPLGQRDCLYFSASIEREWEEEEEYRDDEGRRRTRTVSRRETVMSDQGWVPFYVNDGTGRLKVDPERSDIDLVSSVSRFEPEHAVSFSGGYLRVGGLSFEIGSHRQRRHLRGYHFNESIFEPRGQVYLLGAVVDHGGELTLVHPSEKEQRYVITHKSEEELVSDLDGQTRMFWWASIASAVLGLVLSIYGLVSGNTGF